MAENEPIRLDFGVSSDPGRYGIDAGAMHWNCYVEPVAGGKSQAPLRAADGLSSFGTVTSGGACRGMIEMGGFVYGVWGTILAKLSQSGVVTVLGGIPGTAAVSMAHNDASPRQLVITADGNKYVVTSDVVTEISDEDLPPPNSATFLNQRIIYGIDDGRVFFSAVDDATDISVLDYFTAEGNPDGLVAVFAHMQEVWCFGRESLEVWRDTGNASAPFRRNEAGVIPKGCIGRQTIASLDIDLFWVGDDQVVYMARGYQFKAISNFGVQRAILETTDKSQIEAFTFHMGGHAFYVLSGPTWTWAYNRTTGAWDPRFSYGEPRWRASKSVTLNNMVIVGDYEANAAGNAPVYQMSRSAYDEAGTTMVWRARTNPMHAYPNRMCVDRLHLDFVTGVGLNSSNAHESAPQVGLRWSDDGGFAWSRQLVRSLGAIGKRNTRVVFDGLGMTGRSGRIWEVEISSPVVRSLQDSAIEGDLIGT